MSRYAYCHFCDDIRLEVGSKVSMMGIYNGELHVAAMPVFLPKLCVAVFCTTEFENRFKEIKIRITSGESLLQESIIPKADLDKMQSELAARSSTEDPLKNITIGMHFNLSPFPIERESTVVATVIADQEEILAGKLRIKLSPEIAS